MFSRTFAATVALVVILAGFGQSATAQSEGQPRQSFSKMLNVDALMDNYIRFLSRKYDLSEEQDAFTQEFVHQRVNVFLDRNRDKLAGLVDQLFEVRTGRDMSPEELTAWGRRVLPIYEQAKITIVGANAEWREILTEEQRLIHDEDVKLMYESFTKTEDQLQRIITGQMTVEEFRNPTRRQTPRRMVVERQSGEAPREIVGDSGARSGTVPRPTVRKTSPRTVVSKGEQAESSQRDRSTRDRSRGKSEAKRVSEKDQMGKWEAYVRQFIEKYKLNAEQQTQAYKILKSCQQQADRHMRSCRPLIERLDRQMEKLKGSKEKAQQLSDLTAKRNKLLAKIDDIFENQLKPRLEKLPTRAQREAAAKAPPQKKGDHTAPGKAGSQKAPPHGGKRDGKKG